MRQRHVAVGWSDQHDIGLEPAADTKKIPQNNVYVLVDTIDLAVVRHHRGSHRVHFNRNDVAACAAQVHGDAADASGCVYNDVGGAGRGMVRADFFGSDHEVAGNVAEHASVG